MAIKFVKTVLFYIGAATCALLSFYNLFYKEPNLVASFFPRRSTTTDHTSAKAYRQNRIIDQASFLAATERINTSEMGSQKCYRQIQVWVGSDVPKTPETIECPELVCGVKFVDDRSFETMMRSDIVIHDFHRSGKYWDWEEMQRRRLPNQAWVFYTLEPMTLPTRKYEHLYNYTITYRRESTFVAPYGIYHKSGKLTFQDDQVTNWASGRPNMIAWAASNCRGYTWKRFDFVKELSKHIPVDVYGRCGNSGCIRRSQLCWNHLRTYKFYLALENSECRDYITEKFWENSLQHDLLPIVYGPPKEDYERVAPPNSFIHLQDFTSMEALVQYLKLLSSNDTLYNSYFKWKQGGSANLHYMNNEVKCGMVSKFLDYQKGKSTGFSREGANSTVYDAWQNRCSLDVTGFPHDF